MKLFLDSMYETIRTIWTKWFKVVVLVWISVLFGAVIYLHNQNVDLKFKVKSLKKKTTKAFKSEDGAINNHRQNLILILKRLKALELKSK